MSRTWTRQRVADTATDVILAARDIAKLLQPVPYVDKIAGVLQQIADIMVEMKSNRERCQKLYNQVFLRAEQIRERVERISHTQDPNVHDKLKQELEIQRQSLERLLKELRHMKPTRNSGIRTKVTRIIKRKEFSEALDECTSNMDNLLKAFSEGLLFDAAVTINEMSDKLDKLANSSTPPALVPQALPAKPTLVAGRSVEIAKIVDALLQNEQATHVVLLGLGGMGKTTIALCALHDEKVKLRYGTSRYFISCEPTPTKDLLLNAIANALCLSALEKAEPDQLLSRIVYRLSQLTPALLCLDNFETIWEAPAFRNAVNEVLRYLSAIETLDVVVTMRGVESPEVDGAKWLRMEVPKVELSDALVIYERTVESKEPPDETIHQILEELDGIPLAITLMSRLIQDGIESPKSLQERWKAIDLDALKKSDGDGHRLLSPIASIKLSVESPRMNNEARNLLRLLSFLPDGLCEDFESSIAAIPNFSTHLRTLLRVSLVHRSTDSRTTRYNMLSPIRLYSQRHLASPEKPAVLTGFFVDLLRKHKDPWKHRNQSIILPELRNIRSSLMAMISEETPYADAAVDYTRWSRYMYSCDAEVIRQALQFTHGTRNRSPCCLELGVTQSNRIEAQRLYSESLHLSEEAKDDIGQAKALYRMGELCLSTNRLENAEEAFCKALELNQGQDMIYQAHTHMGIGEIHTERGHFREAGVSLDKALALYNESGYDRGQASIEARLGVLKMKQNNIDAAELSFSSALTLNIQSKDLAGQAYVHSKIGEIQMRRENLEAAEASFSSALVLDEQTQHLAGQAYLHGKIGQIQMRRENLEAAQVSFSSALVLEEPTQNLAVQAYLHGKIGEIQLRRENFEAAEASFSAALAVHEETQDLGGQAYVHSMIGEIRMRRENLEAAEVSFSSALVLDEQTQHLAGQAYLHGKIGQIQMRRENLEAAQVSFSSALVLEEPTQNLAVQAYLHGKIGEIQLRRENFEAAEASFSAALAVHEETQDLGGQAYVHSMIGEIRMRRENLEAAEVSFSSALALREQTQDIVGQAYVHGKIGEIQMRRKNLEAAEASFFSVLTLDEQSQYLDSQGYAHEKLGDIHMQREDLEAAGVSFSSALVFREQTQSLVSQAYLHVKIGEMRMRQENLEAAEASFSSALVLEKQTQHLAGQAYLHSKIGEIQMRRENFEAAEASFFAALAVQEQTQAFDGQAYLHNMIGEIRMRRENLKAAEMSFSSALALDKQTQHLAGQAYLHSKIGEIQMRRENFEAAEASFSSALTLHEQTQDLLGQANAHSKIGEIQMRRENLEAAEVSFSSALVLDEQTHDLAGQAHGHGMIGELQMRRENLEPAEVSFSAALAICEQTQDLNWQADLHDQLGQLYMRRGDLQAAHASFAQSLALYVQINDGRSQDFMRENILKVEEEKQKLALDDISQSNTATYEPETQSS